MSSIKIKDFFNGRFFEIPKYQRGFAWEKQHVREIFEDVNESIESNSNHYIGTLVLSKSSHDEELFYVVDGQQRITTISLIINVLINFLKKSDADYYHRFYIKEEDRYRLKPNGRDQKFFINLLDDIVTDPQNKSQRLLKDAYEEIQLWVENISDKLGFLKSLEKLEIMEFVENSEGDAIRIFQTVNDRGKPLSNMEKAKSLLIYFSNRYLAKRLDDSINDYFSDIFEIYDDIKHVGEELGINLIKNKEFNEDNLMRYHFISFTNEDYDPSAGYVLQYLKNSLITYRNSKGPSKWRQMETFINSYIESMKEFFLACKRVVSRAKTKTKYYKLFCILNLSATLYPLITKLEMIGALEKRLPSKDRNEYKFFDMIEIIDVRIYKTRGTDPKSDVANFTNHLSTGLTLEEIENWLVWFNKRWMGKEEFQSSLSGKIFGNRALNHIFIEYSENLIGKELEIDELKTFVSKTPNIEHILSQTPKFSPKAMGFRNKEDFIDYEDNLGNLTVLEKSLNSSVQNKNPLDKVDYYGRSLYKITRKVAVFIRGNSGFKKQDIIKRTDQLGGYCVERWWC